MFEATLIVVGILIGSGVTLLAFSKGAAMSARAYLGAFPPEFTPIKDIIEGSQETIDLEPDLARYAINSLADQAGVDTAKQQDGQDQHYIDGDPSATPNNWKSVDAN